MDDAADDTLGRLAKERFGLDYLFPLQRLVMANVLDACLSGDASDSGGFRQAAILPTGFGKSLCFQLPALLLPGPTIAVFPLLALMEDQRRRLAELGIGAAVFRGGMDEADRREAEASLRSGKAKIAITNPECLRGRLLDFLASLKPSHVAIDEAHCVSEWGNSFRPAYLELGKAVERLDPPVTTAFTATASPAVLESFSRILFQGRPCTLVQADPDRPNIHYAVSRTLARERTLERLLMELAKPAIVFCTSRDGVQILAERLRMRLGTEELRFYHAGLEAVEKRAIEEWFLGSKDGILVSTCAFGMGMDKRDVRTVIHYDPPPSIEAYLQESGRAGRDGKPSRAVLLSVPGTSPKANAANRDREQALLDYGASEGRCRREALLSLLGTKPEGPCSGCDVCDGNAPGQAEGASAIGLLLRMNRRRFTREEALRLLQGKAGEPPTCAGAGGLRGWREEDAGAAMSAAIKSGMAMERKKGLWKGRLAEEKAWRKEECGPPTAIPRSR
jgi:ATP-dependent DNA helicase RecQ